MMAKQDELTRYYQTTYESLSQGNYATAYDMSYKSDSLFGNKNQYRPKFAMITAMSLVTSRAKKHISPP
jgi:hypothetical protein